MIGKTTPRIFTPPLQPLEPRSAETEKATDGYSVIDFADEMLGIHLMPWQQWLLVHALELRPDDTYRFRNVVVLVARQCGKSTLSQVLALWWMYVCGVRLVLGTAQDLDTAEEVWAGAVDLVHELDDDDEPVRPELSAEVEKVVRINGKYSLNLRSGGRYKIKAANRRAGRGLSGDRIILDELREHQNWDAWAAITKTAMARPGAQIWCFSNAGDATSVVLKYLRQLAHRALGDPDGICANEPDEAGAPDDDALAAEEDDLGIFEWSAEPGCDIWDRDQWAQADPAVGYGLVTERSIASAARTDPEAVLRTEVLCQWVDTVKQGPFPPDAWERCAATKVGDVLPPTERIVPARVTSCLEVAWNRATAYVTVAGHRLDGLPQVELAEFRGGTDWVLDWFCDPNHPERAEWPIVVRKGSAAWTLVEDLRGAGLVVVVWDGMDLGTGAGQFYDAVTQTQVRHTSQPVLNLAAATTGTRPTARGTWFWDLKSPQHPAALAAVNGAWWWLTQGAETPPQALPELVTVTAPQHEMATAGF